MRVIYTFLDGVRYVSLSPLSNTTGVDENGGPSKIYSPGRMCCVDVYILEDHQGITQDVAGRPLTISG